MSQNNKNQLWEVENFKEGKECPPTNSRLSVSQGPRHYDTMAPLSPQQIKMDIFSGIHQGQAFTFIQVTPQRRKESTRAVNFPITSPKVVNW